MPNFESPSINKIFEHRRNFIPEVGRQFEKESTVEVEINGEKLNVDYRIISVASQENEKGDMVVVLPGFGSGWEGVSELGFSLACEGRKVIMPSLPGYGNSDDPSEHYYKTDNFDNEAEVVKHILERIGVHEGEKVHLVGHSMGSEIAATVAEKYPNKVSSVVLLNPAGVEDQMNKLALGGKFILSGMRTVTEYNIKMAFSGERDYENALKKYIPKTRSPFSTQRISQRLAEWDKLSKGHLLEKLKNTDVPITYISGKLDALFPAGNEDDSTSQLARIIESAQDKTTIQKSVMEGLQHNTTIAPDEITAANIDHYLEKAEEKNS